MDNEKGAIYPIVAMIAAFFLTFTLFAIEGYVSDKKFYKETEEKLVLEQLIRLASADLIAELELNGNLSDKNGILFYPKGDVYFEASTVDEQVIKVLMYGSTKGERKMQSLFLYDNLQKKVVKWVEK
ncbi:competence type IV pilus minor pilin ComGG [Bacillus sp. V5-8f]|uniref:competence type IV pilus minor pilin ComGG n=1 Tax=Bacillus sp. V5-8f TaxID=2053044 RepID=UPI000C763F1D|nr:competence type IV pilus minor pilin ComGG [Bacillus sp. V5-8f]PLT34727.1 hypothetical protein CUU64_04780 [Bacillus sp. V5-8f]